MVSLRGAAFVLGAVGLLFFVGGILWAMLVPAHPSCAEFPASADCRQAYQGVLTIVTIVLGVGLVMEAAAVVMLFLHLTKGRSAAAPSEPVRPRGPAPRNNGPAARDPASPDAPRNRFLEPPVPPRQPMNGKR